MKFRETEAMHRQLVLLITFLLACVPCTAFVGAKPAAPSGSPSADDANIATLRMLLKQPEAAIDLARAKVTIDRMVDPKIDRAATLRLVDAWAAKVRARFPPGASNKVKRDLLVSTLYEPGPWNDHSPFDYDYTDPYGKNLRITLLSNYLSTRKGQCVAMPIAFVLIGQKLGLHVALTTAPYHVLAKYGDEEKGAWMNFEATSGRTYYDSQYEASLQIPAEAMNGGIFLRPYTRRESVALFATSTLAPFYRQRRDAERLLQVTELILDANPKDVVAMTLRGDAYYLMIEERFRKKYPDANQIPLAHRPEFHELTRKQLEWYAKAERLGWRQWTKADWEKYRKHFETQKLKSHGGKQ